MTKPRQIEGIFAADDWGQQEEAERECNNVAWDNTRESLRRVGPKWLASGQAHRDEVPAYEKEAIDTNLSERKGVEDASQNFA